MTELGIRMSIKINNYDNGSFGENGYTREPGAELFKE